MDATSLEVCDIASKLRFELVYFLGLLWMLVIYVAVCCDLLFIICFSCSLGKLLHSCLGLPVGPLVFGFFSLFWIGQLKHSLFFEMGKLRSNSNFFNSSLQSEF